MDRNSHSASGYCSITGGYVMRDRSLGRGWTGRYVYGDYCTGSLRVARLQLPLATNDRSLTANVPSLSSFGEDASGCVYGISLSGPVFRLVEDVSSATALCALPLR